MYHDSDLLAGSGTDSDRNLLCAPALSGVAQDPISFYRPLALAPAEGSSSAEPDRHAAPKPETTIDLNDSRVMAAISEALNHPISKLIIPWNQFDATQLHFPSTSLDPERDEWGYRYQFIPTFPIGLGVRHTFNIGQLPVSVDLEAYYSVIHPGDLPGSAGAFASI
jgi:hypothetical protein